MSARPEVILLKPAQLLSVLWRSGGGKGGRISRDSPDNNVIPFKMISQVVTQRTWPNASL